MENDEGTEYRAKIDRPESSIKKTVVDEFASNYEEVKKFDGETLLLLLKSARRTGLASHFIGAKF